MDSRAGFVTRALSLVNLVLWLPRIYATFLAIASDDLLWVSGSYSGPRVVEKMPYLVPG